MPTRRKPRRSPDADRAMHSPRDYQDCASRLKALADPERLKIVTNLLRGEKSVSSLADELNLPIDNVSHHLRVLRAARLVQTQRRGKFVIYSLAEDVVAGSENSAASKTIDLGCCQLDLVQVSLPSDRSHRRPAGQK
jgi:DNA-binding transcriptional ArsR family regulator